MSCCRLIVLIFAVLAGAFLAVDDVQGQAATLSSFPKLSAERDWPWWRGPMRNGFSQGGAAPTKLNDPSILRWKVPMAGRGHSSPIVVGDRIFLTTADEPQQKHSVLAFARDTGKQLWSVQINQGGFPGKNHPKNTEATPTIACDGERLFVSFFHHEGVHLTALSLEGKKLWQEKVQDFNPKRYEYGYAPSPLLYKNLVIVAAEYDGKSFLTALDRTQGKRIWQTPRPNNISFSSPVVGNVAGKDQLLMSGADKVDAYDPATGKPLWSVSGTAAATCGTVVWDGDIVFASGGYPSSETLAVLADGSGKVLWKNGQKCYEQSMLAYDGHLYALTGQGILFCWRAKDGEEKWKKRLTGPVSASPVINGDNIYWANELGTLYVFKANPEKFELVEENHVGKESFPSPAICGGQLFLRVAEMEGGKRQEYLYCFGEK